MNYQMKYPKFETPEAFYAEVIKYFEWADSNPLQEENVWQFRGAIVRADKSKMRAFSKKALAIHVGIPETRLNGYRERGGEWAEVVEFIEQVIFTQKFEGAAANLLNATVITRDLGLADKSEIAGIKDAPPVALSIEPVASGTFLPPETEDA